MRASSDYLVQERHFFLLEKCKTFLDVGNLYLTPSSGWMFCGFLSAVKPCAKCTETHKWESLIVEQESLRVDQVDFTVHVCVCVCVCVLCGKTLMSWWTQKYHWSSVPSIVTTWWRWAQHWTNDMLSLDQEFLPSPCGRSELTKNNLLCEKVVRLC